MSSETETPVAADIEPSPAGVPTGEDRARRLWIAAGLLAAAGCMVGLSTTAGSPPLQPLGRTGAVVAATGALPGAAALAPRLVQVSAPLLASLGRQLAGETVPVAVADDGPSPPPMVAGRGQPRIDESAPAEPVDQPLPATVEVDPRVLVDERGVPMGTL